jgi:Predicted nucleotide-binding protein containing TIR-like domain
MESRIFIGSSKEALEVANAIQAELDRDADCTVWTQGVFGLSNDAVQSLMNQVRCSDFAIFVFTADDVMTVRGELFSVPRDNVIYELGLFSGALGPNRCFFIVPRGSGMHLPSDLLGIKPGEYNNKRADGNMRAAVGPFCGEVRDKLNTLGPRPRVIDERLRDLAVKFECCDWIKDEATRVKEKGLIVTHMVYFCSGQAIDKNALLQARRPGFTTALAAAIRANPESGDDKILLKVRTDTVMRGVGQYTAVDAIITLDDKGKITAAERAALIEWAEAFRDPDPSLASRITAIKAR